MVLARGDVRVVHSGSYEEGSVLLRSWLFDDLGHGGGRAGACGAGRATGSPGRGDRAAAAARSPGCAGADEPRIEQMTGPNGICLRRAEWGHPAAGQRVRAGGRVADRLPGARRAERAPGRCGAEGPPVTSRPGPLAGLPHRPGGRLAHLHRRHRRRLPHQVKTAWRTGLRCLQVRAVGAGGD